MCSQTTALVVPELRDDLILGLPWLVQEEAAIDLKYTDLFNGVLTQQAQVFAAADMLHRTTVTQHTIPTRPHEPCFIKPFGFGPREREAKQTQIAVMLREGVIEPSESPYNCLVVMAKKKDCSLRFCVNFKPIDSVTIPAPPPIINITDALAGLGEAGIFTSLDLKCGYWQVPVCLDDRPKTAFTAPDGRRFQFCAMPSFIPNFAAITTPMNDLLSPKFRFPWTPEADHTLNAVKRLFRECHTLARLKAAEHIYLQTNASQEGMGVVLYQLGTNRERHIVEYTSAKFGPAARRYHVNEQECLVVVWAVGRSRLHLEGRPFILRTDSQCLKWLDSAQGRKSKFTRWALTLQTFDFNVEHMPVRKN
ncbi:uncharacterized protein LOC134533478 [Bacillus rossius redtenbacheri]|uniref:uncharacterized protein LOC134533478 n=1 Tax=Bacillus rossius redtenbacheri TaxID=93214 RepID=UPI002FDCCCE4